MQSLAWIKLQCSIFNVQCSIFIFPSWEGIKGWVRCGIGLVALITASVCFPFSAQSQSLQQIHSGLNQATSLYVTQNDIYVVEQGGHRLLKMDHNGKIQDTIGGRGSGNYEFSHPVDVHATNGLKIFVSDYNNRRIQVFDRRGQYLSSIAGGNHFGHRRHYEPTQLAVNNLAEVYFYDENAGEIILFDLDYNPLDAFRLPSDVESVDDIKMSDSHMFILDQSAAVIHELERSGSYRSFYEAENMGAFFVEGETIWMVGETGLTILNNLEEPRLYSITESIAPVGLHVQDNTAYILTADALYKWQLP